MSKKLILGLGVMAFLIGGYFIADSMLFDGVKPRVINENGFQANYFAKADTKKTTAIVLIGGGQWGDYWGQEFANKGWVGLSLPYIRREGLPQLPEEINLEYFEKALLWMGKQSEVDPNKIVVMGASRNAELSLVIASVLPELVNGVVAYAPSSVAWSNTVLPFNSNELKPSWKYQGADIPYVPMDKIVGNDSNKIETLAYWKSGLDKTDEVALASIKVEKINGPVLLFSGKDDKVWPSALMADQIEQRLSQHNFKHAFQSIKYENTGHLVSSHPEVDAELRTGKMNIGGKEYEFDFGGTNEGDRKAKQDAKMKLFDFLENRL